MPAGRSVPRSLTTRTPRSGGWVVSDNERSEARGTGRPSSYGLTTLGGLCRSLAGAASDLSPNAGRSRSQTAARPTTVGEGTANRSERLAHFGVVSHPAYTSAATSPSSSNVMTLPGDNPIRSSDDDRLGRREPARAFARQLLSLDASEGLVVGVLGPWGFGKTSFINLAREELRTRADILDFNPWMFSGAEQLVQSFFVEVAAQLKVRPGLADVGEDLQNYGEALSGLGWLPLVGPWIERGRGATKLLGQLLKRRQEGATSRRDLLREKLADLSRPIVVVLDDIDRLTTTEIRDVFRLVRLTASFPNLIYVVAFDRARVETALGDEGVPGRDYLEKILQLAIDLPSVSDAALIQQTAEVIDEAVLLRASRSIWTQRCGRTCSWR